MDDSELHSRCSRIEKQIRDFRLINPEGAVQGGFGELKVGARDIQERIGNIQKAIAGFSLTGTSGVNVSGNVETGYAISITEANS